MLGNLSLLIMRTYYIGYIITDYAGETLKGDDIIELKGTICALFILEKCYIKQYEKVAKSFKITFYEEVRESYISV